MPRTTPFSKAAIRNACIAGAFAVAPLGLLAIGAIAGPGEEAINKNKAAIDRCIELKGDTLSCDSIKLGKGYIPQGYQPSADIAKQLRADHLKQEAKAAEARKAEEAKAQARAAKEAADRKAAAEAKFKAEGWFQLQPGIYGRWCTSTCSRAEVIGNASYWLMEVWAKDRAAGDIYAQINVLQNGTVVGWTNDTAYLSKGQRGVLTFSKYLPGYGSQYTAQLTKFNARG